MRYFIVLFVSLLSISSYAQQKTLIERLYDKFLSQQSDTSGKSSLLVLPSGGYAPETGLSAGAQAIYSFYRGDRHSTNPSMITASATYSTKKMVNAKLVADVWSKHNDLHGNAEIRYRKYPLSFFGTGNNTREADLDRLTENKFVFKGFIDKKLAPGFYGGIRAGFENYEYTDQESGGIFTQMLYDQFRTGKVIYAGLQQTIDTRNSINYTTRGNYFNTSISYAPRFFKGNHFSGAILLADYRNFLSATDKITIAFQAISRHFFSHGSMPFYLMPEMGNDEIMRGYFQGRFRDKYYTAAQAEIKYRFTPRFGLVAFGGLGEVYGQRPFAVNGVKPNYGAGLRYFYDLEKNISIRLDYGFGEKRAGEKRQRGFYISLNEAF